MNVTLCSAFRNSESAGHLDRYFKQASALDAALAYRGDSLNFVLGESDSTDSTVDRLEYFLRGVDGMAVDCTHNGPVFGSVADPQRFKQLAGVGNKIWSQIPASADVVVWVESDLTWEASTIVALINRLKEYSVVAPMVMHQTNPGLYQGDGPFWYDVWAFRRNGVRFTNEPPYHADIDGGMIQMDSIGSCWAMTAELAEQVSFPEEDVVVGMCKIITKLGETIFLDTSLEVFHG